MRLNFIAILFVLVTICGPMLQAGEICGEPTKVTLVAGQHIDAGSVIVWNDTENLYVQFVTKDGWLLTETHLAVETSLSAIPQTNSGNPKVGHFEYSSTHNPPVTEYTYTISLGKNSFTVGTKLFIAAHAVVIKVDKNGEQVQEETAWGKGEGFPGSNWAMYFKYVVQSCKKDPGKHRTHTKDAWGAKCECGCESKAACYRDKHFAKAFPNGLVVGCAKYTLTLTSAKAVEVFLPGCGCAPGVLYNSFVNPPADLKTGAGVLAAHTVALVLNVQFDLYDPNFAPSTDNLKDLVFEDPNNPLNPCNGLTVEKILKEANSILGGCGSTLGLTPAQISYAVARINENFVDGTHNEGYLRLP